MTATPLRLPSGRYMQELYLLEQHQSMRAGLLEEERRLQELVDELQEQSPEPTAMQRLHDLRYHSLWIQLLQGQEENVGLNAAFNELQWKRDSLPLNHVLEIAASSAQAALLWPGEVQVDGIEELLTAQFMTCRL